ncbi:hypothetical protein JOC93_001521 [Priestia taiwanensis]|uniref:Uncharacterized protein n=1 Tax=Priestia taiwanensis TaxID=1347902 RepID=A0A917AQ18_9BACI|nr:hypothetical protein [Priestia taiwanensis]GGE66023.1 hypothetical protein GCM10007140_15210 [Priestia taiwanensis]
MNGQSTSEPDPSSRYEKIMILWTIFVHPIDGRNKCRSSL